MSLIVYLMLVDDSVGFLFGYVYVMAALILNVACDGVRVFVRA